MSRRPMRSAFIAAALIVCSAMTAHAGQVRITVTSNLFSPNSINLNNGDQVVWVWVQAGHSVTSGVSGQPGVGSIFNTGVLAVSGAAFTWKSDRNGTIPFHCIPHALSGMTGSLGIAASGTPVSSFRITEVQFAANGGLDRIEITNLGSDIGDLGMYRISVANASSVTIPLASKIMVAGQRLVIHCNESGTNNANNLFLPAIGDLPLTGSVGLYVPYVTAPGASLTDAKQMVDYVQWGAGAGPNEVTASAAGYWGSGDFLSGADNPGYSISFCGNESQRGIAFWNVTTPNFNTSTICSTASLKSSWGRIKQIYR